MYSYSFSLILIQGINSIRLFRRYKQEQLEEIKAERERIEAERLESQKLMQELMALKEQLVGKETEDEASAAASDSD